MSPHRAVKLSALRDIGWREWDPIGLGPDWGEHAAADECDAYLLHASRCLQTGQPAGAVVEYLRCPQLVESAR